MFWNYVGKNQKTITTIGNILDKDDKKVENDETKANVFNEYFASVFKISINTSTSFIKRNYQSTLDDMEITEDDVLKAISEINPNKSIGPDNIHPKAIVECKLELSNPLTIIFNKSLNEGRIPEIWKTANVTPIYKSGTKEDPGNYRPISISPVCSNIMQKILKKRIMHHLKVNNLLSKDQFGFVNGKSCTLQLLEVIDDWTESLDSGNEVDTIFFFTLEKHLTQSAIQN